MNAILLTNGTDRQTGTTAAGGSKQEAMVKPAFRQHPTQNYRKWATAGAGVETALFVSVQAVMVACVVVVAAQLFATV